jgi:hypothetical protein
MSDTTALLAEIDAYCARHGISEKTFGQKVVRNWKLVPRLRDGKSVTLRTAAVIREHLAKSAASQRAVA